MLHIRIFPLISLAGVIYFYCFHTGASVDSALNSRNPWSNAADIIHIGLAFIITLTVILGLGLCVRYRMQKWMANLGSILFPGPLFLAMLGIGVWALPNTDQKRLLVLAAVGTMLVWMIRVSWKKTFSSFANQFERQAMKLCILASCLALCKSMLSFGPRGELYSGTISRTLEIGDRPDSRIPYHVVQVTANNLAAGSKEQYNLFQPYTFGSRTPLLGFIATPLVVMTARQVPVSPPDMKWVPFDDQGFMVFRIVAMVLASLLIISVFCAIGEWDHNYNAAVVGAWVLILTPFFIHELYFTWPKSAAAAYVILAFSLINAKNLWLAGIASGLGYLFHPMALMSTPILGLWLMWREGSWRSILKSIWPLPLGFLLVSLPWQVTFLDSQQQGDFLRYIFEADAKPAGSITHWLLSRLDNLANTLVPGYVYFQHRTDPRLNALGTNSSEVLRFFFQYWLSVPFGTGLIMWLWTLRMQGEVFLKLWKVALFLIAFPFLCFWVYWGSNATGLMREGLHVVFASGIALFAWGLTRIPARTSYFFNERITVAACLMEVWLTIFYPSLVDKSAKMSQFPLSDSVAILLSLWIMYETFRFSRKLSLARSDCE